MLLAGKFNIIFFYVLVYIHLLFNLPVLAQNRNTTPTNFPEPIFEHFTIADGLPENSVKCILQDHLGYMWFGTQNGLVRYDGYDMNVYQPDPDDSLSISGRAINIIYEDRSGTLWVGTGEAEMGGLIKFDRESETFTSYSHNPDDSTSINSNFVNCIYEDNNGNFWVGTREGLNLFDRTGESFERIYYQGSTYSPAVYEYVLSLKAGRKPLGSILRVRDYANLTTTFTLKKEMTALVIIMDEPGYDYGWLESANGEIIVGHDNNNVMNVGGNTDSQIRIVIDTLNRGEYRLRYASGDRSYNSWGDIPLDYPEFRGIQVIELAEDPGTIGEMLQNKQAALLKNEIRAIVEDRLTGKLYIGSSNRLLICDRENRSLAEYGNNVWLNGEINSFHQSKDGSIWIGHTMGISKLNTQSNSIKHYQPTLY